MHFEAHPQSFSTEALVLMDNFSDEFGNIVIKIEVLGVECRPVYLTLIL